MIKFKFFSLVLFSILIVCSKKENIETPGALPDGSIRLHNRWLLTPAGFQIPVGTLPLGLAVSPDGKYIAVTNNGYSEHFVSIIDVARRMEVRHINLSDAFLGLSFDPSGKHLYVSGGTSNKAFVYKFREGSIKLKKAYVFGERKGTLITGLAVTPDESKMLVLSASANLMYVIDLIKEEIIRTVPVGVTPYSVLIAGDGKRAFVSNWGGKSVSVIDLEQYAITNVIEVGSHPNAMVLTRDDRKLFIANANSDNISVIDLTSNNVIETISVAPYLNAPYGSTPNALAISKDGKTLYSVNADNNCLAVIDVSSVPAKINGLIPTAWYPTGVALNYNEDIIYVLNGKGMGSKPNPRGPKNFMYNLNGLDVQYIPRLFYGTLSMIHKPDPSILSQLTEQVRKNNWIGGMEEKISEKPQNREPVVVPRRVGEPSKIKHVLYIIKENRTYDQVFGDLPQGNGDSSLTLFPRFVSPNHHKLAEAFTLFDNFYVDAEVSSNGHQWSMAAIATDFMEKQWPLSYSGRGGLSGPLNYPDIGYLFDMAQRAGISYRVYGEFVLLDAPEKEPYTKFKNLKDHFSPDYRGYDVSYPDMKRAEVYLLELKEFEKSGEFPQLQIMSLPNDHTAGTSLGYPTPEAMVADNDLSFGLIIEAISKSIFWKETAIFVLEDDAQLGADHIDAHRSPAFVISPYTKRGFVDHNMYDTVSMLRTIELILGLPPMSQYDAAAVPMVDCFTETPDFTPYMHVPNTVPLDQMNDPDAYGSKEISAMNLKDVDAVPERRFNEILWKAVKGRNSEMPKPKYNRPSYKNNADDYTNISE